MLIRIAKTAGFCMGVQRAVEMILDLAAANGQAPLYTFGPLIHNTQVLELLRRKGIQVLDHIPARGHGTVLIRAHGVPPEVRAQLEHAGFDVRDATCRRVVKIQNIIRAYTRQGAEAIIFGDRDHPEVIGLQGYAQGRGHVVDNLEQLKALPVFDRACVVTQSTQNMALFDALRQWAGEHRPRYEVFNTICDTTEKRQSELRRLTAEVEAVVVVGGRTSGNTLRLADVARESGKPVWHIETGEDLGGHDQRLLASFGTVGISAGASTPDWVIRRVVRALNCLPDPPKTGIFPFPDPLKVLWRAQGRRDSLDGAMQADRAQYFLKKVSRSFALTIPQLPAGLREKVANAYLLCRILDTIEDEQGLRLEEKRNYFRDFIAVVDGENSADAFAAELAPKLRASTLPAERELVRETAAVVQRYFQYSLEQRVIIRRCLNIMAAGMLHFQEIKSSAGLPDIRHLSAYCYYVAGVVGEMLTDLFCHYSRETAVNREFLFSRASSFGLGLQMTNILKDVWEDRERGACWLPRDLFENIGCNLAGIQQGESAPSFGQGIGELIGIAHGHLVQALEYSLRIPPHECGMRKFCLWAVGMALATLQNIHHNRDYASAEEIKITRRRLKSIILASNLAVQRDWQLRLLFRMAARGLPLARSAEIQAATPKSPGPQPHWRTSAYGQASFGIGK